MKRQALHDAVVRYNAKWLAGLVDRPKSRRRPVLDAEERVALVQPVLAPLDEETAQRWGKRLHPATLSRVLRNLGLSKHRTRPRHRQADPEAQKAF